MPKTTARKVSCNETLTVTAGDVASPGTRTGEKVNDLLALLGSSRALFRIGG